MAAKEKDSIVLLFCGYCTFKCVIQRCCAIVIPFGANGHGGLCLSALGILAGCSFRGFISDKRNSHLGARAFFLGSSRTD